MNAFASLKPRDLPDQSELIASIRRDFPILETRMHGKPLIYFDNAATTQKPQAVIDAIVHYYSHDNANIHRGLYELSQRATDRYESARKTIAQFLGGVDPDECIFTRGTTEGINLIATTWGGTHLGPGDEIVLTGLEHHSNIVPWQMVCRATGAKIRVVQPNSEGEIDLADFRRALSTRTKLVSVQHISNSLGTVHDIKAMIELSHDAGALVLVDGAQSIAHLPTRLPELGCDFFVFSGHKLYGPTGIGVLWGRRAIMEVLPPFLGGGDMIKTVSFEESTYADLPNRFEAGTPHIAGAIGLAAAVDYVQSIGFEVIQRHESVLLNRMNAVMSQIPGVRIIGSAKDRAATVSFVVDEPPIAPMDIALALSNEGIAIRTGHHCCMPLMNHLGIPGTCRASMAIYNTTQEIDRFGQVLIQILDEHRNRISSQTREKSGTVDEGRPLVGGIVFAPSSGLSPDEVASELTEDFLFCDDPQSKTQYLLELGEQLPRSFDQLKAITTSVPGCMSEVYLIGRPTGPDSSRIELAGDSNAEIVRGLIALLQKLLSGQSAKDVLDFNLEEFFRRIGLEHFITSQRRSGLGGMVQRIQTLAEGIANPTSE
jgi:cysteine desulfurase / selenocysteine lyase